MLTVQITSYAATWFLPFALPICLWVMFSDLSTMRIRNKAVIALAVIFLAVAPFVMPISAIPWQLVQLVIVLLVGMVLNAAGLLGAGDAKFCAAAAPFVAPGDSLIVLQILFAMMLIAFVAHRLARMSPLRNLAPDWESWTAQGKFPLGLALGPSLILYLGLGIQYGG